MDETESMPITWLRAKEAAVQLKFKSQRSVLLLAEKGEIQSKRERDPASNQVVVLLHAGDVERIAYEREHPKQATAVVKAAQAVETQACAAIPGAAVQAAQAEANPGYTAFLPPVLRLELVRIRSGVLTVKQVAQQFQTSERAVLQLIESGKLPALDLGKGTRGGRYRVNQAEVDRMKP